MSSLIDFLSYFFLFLFLCFYVIKIWERKKDYMGGLRYQNSWRKFFNQEIKGWCLVERKVREKIVFSYYFFFHINISLFYIFYMIKNMKEKEGCYGEFMLQRVGAWWSYFGHDMIMFWWKKKKKRRSFLKVSFRTLLLHKSWDFSMRKIRYHKIWKLEKYQ